MKTKIKPNENVKYVRPTVQGKFYTMNDYGHLIPLPREMQDTRDFKGEVGAVLKVEGEYVIFSIGSPWEQQLYIKDLISSVIRTKEKQKDLWWGGKEKGRVVKVRKTDS